MCAIIAELLSKHVVSLVESHSWYCFVLGKMWLQISLRLVEPESGAKAGFLNQFSEIFMCIGIYKVWIFYITCFMAFAFQRHRVTF